MLVRLESIKLLLISLSFLIFLGCASAAMVGTSVTVGDRKYHYIEGRTHATAGPSICVVNVIETDLQDKNSKLVYSTSASTGGALDSVFSSGKLLNVGISSMTNNFGIP